MTPLTGFSDLVHNQCRMTYHPFTLDQKNRFDHSITVLNFNVNRTVLFLTVPEHNGYVIRSRTFPEQFHY